MVLALKEDVWSSADINGPWDWRTLCGLQVSQHFRASFMLNLTCFEEAGLEKEALLCRGTLNPPWARARPASPCAKLCIGQQTLMEVLNSFIAPFSTWRAIHQIGTARGADHSAAIPENRSALKASFLSILLFTQTVAGRLQLGMVLLMVAHGTPCEAADPLVSYKAPWVSPVLLCCPWAGGGKGSAFTES